MSKQTFLRNISTEIIRSEQQIQASKVMRKVKESAERLRGKVSKPVLLTFCRNMEEARIELENSLEKQLRNRHRMYFCFEDFVPIVISPIEFMGIIKIENRITEIFSGIPILGEIDGVSQTNIWISSEGLDRYTIAEAISGLEPHKDKRVLALQTNYAHERNHVIFDIHVGEFSVFDDMLLRFHSKLFMALNEFHSYLAEAKVSPEQTAIQMLRRSSGQEHEEGKEKFRKIVGIRYRPKKYDPNHKEVEDTAEQIRKKLDVIELIEENYGIPAFFRGFLRARGEVERILREYSPDNAQRASEICGLNQTKTEAMIAYFKREKMMAERFMGMVEKAQEVAKELGI